MKSMIPGAWLVAFAVVATGCASAPAVRVHLPPQAPVSIPGVDACDDFATGLVKLDPGRPVTILVHGCKASSGRFRTLAQVLEASGRQTLCFNYNYRRSIRATAAELAEVLAAIAGLLDRPEIIVVGHSQGGLVARQAVVDSTSRAVASLPPDGVRLVTIASPFNGIEASAHCGVPIMHVVTFGIAAAICQATVGSIWTEIHPRAESVTAPQALAASVNGHLHIVTDERDSCRRFATDGSCVEDDFVFSVAEQLNSAILADWRVENVVVRSGHVAIVGDDDRPPWQLIELFEAHGVMPATAPGRVAAMHELITRLY